MIWYIEDIARFRRERAAISALVGEVDWLVPFDWRVDTSARAIWDAEIVVGDRRFPIALQYPNHFPYSPPLVVPRGDQTRWSSHQYGAGGELCLEYGPDNWRPEITGADMIRSAYRLLQGERPADGETALVASRHDLTVGQELRGEPLRLLLTGPLRDYVAKLAVDAVHKGKIIAQYHPRLSVYLVASLDAPTGETWSADLSPTVSYEGYERATAFVRWPADRALPSTESKTAFLADIERALPGGLDVDRMFIARGDTLNGYLLGSEKDAVYTIVNVEAPAAVQRLDDGHVNLAARRVAIVGCGSLGSKLAVMLARSGVRSFLLIDDDILLPDNLVRNDLDWREIGAHKADAVARRIDLVQPGAQCDRRVHRLGGQQSSGSVEDLITELAACDLIVDASADPHVFNYLSAAAAIGSKPMLWAEIFGGGFGGLIARARPGLEPDPPTVRATIENWCAANHAPLERAGPDYSGCRGDRVMIADDADVSVIAGHAARLAVDTLIPRSPSIFPQSVYLIGLAQHWLFEQPFDTRPIEVGPATPRAVVAPEEQELTDDDRTVIRDMILRLANASSSAADDPA